MKRAQIHYKTLSTSAFSQLFAALNNRIHVFESVFGEGLNGLYIVHRCGSVRPRILILIRSLQRCKKKRDEYCSCFTFFKALNELYYGAHSVDTSVARKQNVLTIKLYPWRKKYKPKCQCQALTIGFKSVIVANEVDKTGQDRLNGCQRGVKNIIKIILTVAHFRIRSISCFRTGF